MVTPVKKVPIHLQSAANRLLIKGASIVNHDGVTQADVYVEDTKIKQVSSVLYGTKTILLLLDTYSPLSNKRSGSHTLSMGNNGMVNNGQWYQVLKILGKIRVTST